MRGVLLRLLEDLVLNEYHLTLLRDGVTLSYDPHPEPDCRLLLTAAGKLRSYAEGERGKAVDDFIELSADDPPANDAGQPVGEGNP